ncbi:glycosyltransferase family 4 protein [Candidatus Methanomassiliicoccus intestinalis]|uniref:glycosyltransferase family 4 protein n=1 Tax=Candidatus Methanomassiliicoccus intestinalis TaxID=1406512 RepID=UPI0037DC8CFD
MKIAIVALNDYAQVKGGTEVFSEHLQKVFPQSTLITAAHSSRAIFNKLGLQNEYRSWKVGQEFKQRQEKYDVILRNVYAGWNIGNPCPIVNIFHFTYSGFANEALKDQCGRLQARYLSTLFEKKCLRQGINVAVSAKVQRELKKYYKAESRVIENAVPDIFHKIPQETARAELGVTHKGLMGIFVGRADQTKGFDIVSKISKQMKILCVTPSEVPSSKGMIVRQNVDYYDMPKYYSAADFLLFPSRYESSGYSIMEALKCGIPVVAAKTGILEDMHSEDVGEIVELDNEEGYLKGIKKVINADRKPSPEIMARFSMERFEKEYKELLKELV